MACGNAKLWGINDNDNNDVYFKSLKLLTCIRQFQL